MSNHLIVSYALVMLRCDDQILFIKRTNTAGFAPGCYSLVGGKVEKNETFRKSLIREIFEEVGVIVHQDD